MNPERSQFEQWAVDWLDGRLDPEKEKIFLSFLDNNPDLRDELEFLSGCSLSSPGQIFKNKAKLKRTPLDITDTQFDLLAVASLEKDLSPGQEKELEYLILSDTRRKEQYFRISKLKLNPPFVQFKGKRKLHKEMPAVRIRRIMLVSTSIAASVAAIVFLFAITQKRNEKQVLQAVSVSPTIIVDTIIKSNKESNTRLSEIVAKTKTKKASIKNSDIIPDQLEENRISEKSTLFMVEPVTVMIAGLSLPSFSNPEETHGLQSPPSLVNNESKLPENKLNPGNFIGKIFKKSNSGKSINGFDIAEAGVDGINKLLGWQMALEKTTADNGSNRSVSFSSRLIKIKTPVKKTESSLIAAQQ